VDKKKQQEKHPSESVNPAYQPLVKLGRIFVIVVNCLSKTIRPVLTKSL